MTIRAVSLLTVCGLLALTLPAAAQQSIRQEAAGYAVTLRLPPGGLVAGEEMQIEFRLEDLRGPSPVRYARVRGVVDMPAMPSMGRFDELAHAEGVVGDYGVHPTFAHGGDFRLTLTLLPPEQQLGTMMPRSVSGFTMEFPLSVADAGTRKSGPGPSVRRYDLQLRAAAPLRADATVLLEIAVMQHDVAIPLPNGRYQVGDAPVREFDLVHEQPLHLFVVRDDLGVFLHEHPAPTTPGAFGLPLRLPTPGRYRVFADVAPRNAGSQILTGELIVPGAAPSRYDLAGAFAEQRTRAQERDGLRVEWQWGSPLPEGRTVTMTASLTAGGKPVDDLEPYLGAMGHLMLVHEDGATFVHSHPDEHAAVTTNITSVPFLARFPKAGLYRAWAQFQRAGKVLTTDFVIRVP